MRWASPVIWMRRTVAADTVLGETELHEGDKVIMFYNSANRDEDVFDDPFTFDVRRDTQPPHRLRGGGTALLPRAPTWPARRST